MTMTTTTANIETIRDFLALPADGKQSAFFDDRRVWNGWLTVSKGVQVEIGDAWAAMRRAARRDETCHNVRVWIMSASRNISTIVYV
jgi:hypothetical protein